MLLYHLARGRAGHVHSHVAATDHYYSFADRELVSQVDVQEKINALVDTVKIDAGNRKLSAAMGAYRDQHRVKALLAKIAHGEVFSRPLVELESDISRVQDFSVLGFHNIAR